MTPVSLPSLPFPTQLFSCPLSPLRSSPFSFFHRGAVHPPKANSAFYPSGIGEWVPVSRVPVSGGKAKAGMVHSVSGCKRVVQVKLWDPLRTRAIPERPTGVITTRRYTYPRLPYLTLPKLHRAQKFHSAANALCKRLVTSYSTYCRFRSLVGFPLTLSLGKGHPPKYFGVASPVLYFP